MDGEEGSDQTLEASPLREHDQLKDAFADMYQALNSWSNLHLSIYKLQKRAQHIFYLMSMKFGLLLLAVR